MLLLYFTMLLPLHRSTAMYRCSHSRNISHLANGIERQQSQSHSLFSRAQCECLVGRSVCQSAFFLFSVGWSENRKKNRSVVLETAIAAVVHTQNKRNEKIFVEKTEKSVGNSIEKRAQVAT